MTSPTTSAISERLRAETAPHHQAIENARRFSRLGSDDLTLQDYIDILERFYGYYKPLEVQFACHAEIMEALDYERRFKLPLLKKDLFHFGHTDESLANLPVCEQLPPTETPSQAIGSIYVMEGSTHGGQFIAKRLRQQFQLEHAGLAFYACYGENTMPQWKAFKAYLDAGFNDAHGKSNQDEVVSAAVRTFETLQHWMDS